MDASFTLDIFGAGGIFLESLTLNGTNQGVFDEGCAGLSPVTNIEFARVSSLNSSGGSSFNFSIDDLRFDGAASVPEPGTLVLLGVGLAALGFRRRHVL